MQKMDNLAQRSRRVFPAASNGEFNLPARLAKVITRGRGCELFTSDGQRMLDFSMGWGSVLPGHARPEIVDAVTEQASRGTNFSYVTDQSLALAEEIIEASPACEMVRFSASGTEATMYCLRIARAYTRRPKVLKFEGAYHGSHDVGVASLFPTERAAFPACISSSAGVEPSMTGNTLVAPFNDLARADHIVEEFKDHLAAIIVEPLQRCLPPAPGFLDGLRKIASRVGAVLIFDEVVTGFRLAYGGAQEYYGAVPDLVAYGKALGGGLPIGAYGGRRELMQLVCEDRLGRRDYVWTASTLGGNPVSAAAARAALRLYRGPGVYERLHRLGEYLRRGMRETLAARSIQAVVLGDGPLAQVGLVRETPHDYRSSQHADPALARRFMLELFARGVFLNPMGTKLYLSLAHDEATCDQFCQIFGQALDAVWTESAEST
jgi:glutamate-1-semialdehyde 2,1-aminomutase